MTGMGDAELLAAFESQIRRDVGPDQPGWVHEWVGPLLRSTAPEWTGRGGGITCSDLGELTGPAVDALVAEQVAYFAALGRPWEWKTYGHDLPADLPARLEAAGLVAEDEEALVVGEVDAVLRACATAESPQGVTVREPTDDDYAGIAALRHTVWGDAAAARTDELVAEKAADPAALTILVAAADGQVVSAAWVRFHAGTEFASLWGGSTLPQWRRRGIYRALVRRRAEEARARGHRFLQVDASPESRPILESLGMHIVGSTTPYVWSPGLDPVVEDALRRGDVAYEVLPCAPDLADTAAFCAHYGYAVEQAANTIVVASKRVDPPVYAVCVVLGTTRLDVNHRVSELLGVKRLSFADAEVTRELTGMMIGGVTPFGLDGLPVYVDSAVLNQDRVVMGGGNRTSKLLLDPRELTKLPNVVVADGLARPRLTVSWGFGCWSGAGRSASPNTRLALMSTASIRVRSSTVRARFSASSRWACRSRARSTALRTLRALANRGLPLRRSGTREHAGRAFVESP